MGEPGEEMRPAVLSSKQITQPCFSVVVYAPRVGGFVFLREGSNPVGIKERK